MQFTTARISIVSASAALAVAASGLVGFAAFASGDTAPDRVAKVPTIQAPAYAGDPWEKRFREQFWSTQHIHDSWNRCHLGENVPPQLQSGPGC